MNLDLIEFVESPKNIWGGNMEYKPEKVLIVDDSIMVRSELRDILEDLGVPEINETDDGDKALQIISSADPGYDLILLDWNLPKFSGLDVLIACRKKMNLAELPIVMVTAERDKQEVVRALSEGASGYIVKPFTRNGVLARIEAAMQKLKASA